MFTLGISHCLSLSNAASSYLWYIPARARNVSSFMYLHLTIPPTLIIYEVTNVRACLH